MSGYMAPAWVTPPCKTPMARCSNVLLLLKTVSLACQPQNGCQSGRHTKRSALRKQIQPPTTERQPVLAGLVR